MKPNKKWIDDWLARESTAREISVSADLLRFFIDFWEELGLDGKSTTTKNRYAGALHALGGYIAEEAAFHDDMDMTTSQFLHKYVGTDDGPLIHHNNENWQNELDMVCRKLYRYMNKV